MTPEGMCSMLRLAKHYDASLCINNPRKVLFSTIRISSTGFITRHYTNQTWASRASRWTRYFLRAWKKIIFHFPESWNQATMLNKWLSWSRFWVRKFSMIHRTLQNTWFGTKISRAFSTPVIPSREFLQTAEQVNADGEQTCSTMVNTFLQNLFRIG